MQLGCSLGTRIWGILVLVVLDGCGQQPLQRSLAVVSGLVSHHLCSEHFVSRLDPPRVYQEGLAPRGGFGLVNWAVCYDVDAAHGTVTASIRGWQPSRAVYRRDVGCLVERGLVPDIPTMEPFRDAALLAEIAPPSVVPPPRGPLQQAIDAAFDEVDGQATRQTRAVVVVHHGRVIAERYGAGIEVDTPLLGYSATKSVVSALIGILVRDGRLDVATPAPVAAWSDEGDPRHAITTDHLLRMTSGLDLDESGSPLSPVAQMLYVEHDMAAYAARAPLAAPPGTTWDYSSGSTLLLSGIVRDAVGGDAAAVLRFVREELFEPLGMRSAVLELDATGTPLGSTYLFASARDWARFGLLYLQDGVVGGRRILPEGWVKYSVMPTLDTGYGAGWWTNRVDGYIPWSPVRWSIPGAPADTFCARGMLGQFVAVIPSRQLVIVRLAATHQDDGDLDGFGALVQGVVQAIGTPSDS